MQTPNAALALGHLRERKAALRVPAVSYQLPANLMKLSALDAALICTNVVTVQQSARLVSGE